MDENLNVKKPISIKKLIGMFIALLIPLFSISLSIYLVTKNISINDFIFQFGKSSKKDKIEQASSAPQSNQAVLSIFAEKLDPVFSDPVKLVVGSINMNIDLVRVGLKADGTMETPDSWYKAGWYENGAMPGEKKNLIINGHYDTNTGAPGAFWNLKNIKEGDKVEVRDKYGRIFTYNVIKLSYISIDDPSRLDVLNDEKDKSTLTLITCGGVWLGSEYNKRLIIKAELEHK